METGLQLNNPPPANTALLNQGPLVTGVRGNNMNHHRQLIAVEPKIHHAMNSLNSNSRTGDDRFEERMIERDRLRVLVRQLSTGPHRSAGDAKDFANRHGLRVKPLGCIHKQRK